MLLLSTIHGSRLHGLSHSGSDDDYFEVHSGKFGTVHRHRGKDDTVLMSLDQFLTLAGRGSQQALEAMWSTKADVDNMPWRFNFHPNLGESCERYTRTIKKFAADPSRKKQRHAWRLKLNLSDLLNCGHFNPTLDPEQRQMIEWMVDHKVHPLG